MRDRWFAYVIALAYFTLIWGAMITFFLDGNTVGFILGLMLAFPVVAIGAG